MEQFVEFVGNHPLLFFSFAGVLGLLLWNILGDSIQGINNITPQEATLKINHDEALVLDVREDSEFTEGHILDAMHIPLGSLSAKINSLEKYRQHPIIVSCRSGNRSGHACHVLKKNQFEQVFNLKGGVIAWETTGLPLTKGRK
jgi:rhodanese-related sulfurtransferase